MKNNPTKDHHFVPQCYLNEFTQDKVVYCLDTELFRSGRSDKVRQTTPRQACKEINLYLMEDRDQFFLEDKTISDPLYLETIAFKKFEDHYPRIKAAMVNEGITASADAEIFLNFIIDLKIRNPHFLKLVPPALKSYLPGVLDEEINKLTLDSEIVPEENHKYVHQTIKKMVLDNTLHNPDFARQMGISFLINRSNEQTHLEQTVFSDLLQLKWFIYRIESEGEFITNDNPGFSIDGKFEFHNTMFKDDFQFHLPIDPKHCFVVNGNVPDALITQIPGVKFIEFRIASNAFINQVNVGHLFNQTQFLYAKSKIILEDLREKLKECQGLNT